MPLNKSGSEGAFKQNVKTLMGEVGKSPHVQSRSQALAIAYATKRRGRAMGGIASNPFTLRNVVRREMHTGPIMSAVPGRTDKHAMNVPSGSYVVPADVVSHLGQNNTSAGMQVLHKELHGGPYGGPGAKTPKIKGLGLPKPPKMSMANKGGRKNDHHMGSPVPVMTAGGEYVIPPEIVLQFGNGDLKRGHAELDKRIMNLRKKHIQTLRKLPPPAKS